MIYQESHGNRDRVDGGYALVGRDSVTFRLASYDRNLPLIVDPLLTYVSYLGGNFVDFARGIAVDDAGEAIITGSTSSLDFPVQGAFQPQLFGAQGFNDAFVTKVSADGTALIYSTYVGGIENDGAAGIAVDPSGNAYITGFTSSVDFPVTVGAFSTVYQPIGGLEAFVTAFDPDGGLIYSTFFPGGTGTAIAVDSLGDAYVAGGAAVGKFNPIGTSLLYLTTIPDLGQPGSGLSGVAVDAAGNAYVIGQVTSGATFVLCKLNSDGSVSF